MHLSIALLLPLAAHVLSHGYVTSPSLAQCPTSHLPKNQANNFSPPNSHVQSLVMDSKTYTAFLPVKTPDFTAPPPSIMRKVGGDGPVLDISTSNITCNVGAMPISDSGVSRTGAVTAGSKMTFWWPGWPHSGPVLTWMARCANDNCGTFTGGSGNVWFKIDQVGYNKTTMLWASYYLDQVKSWNVTIPACLAPGEYLVRHETIALSDCKTAGRCQFYPSCTQVKVSGSGTYVVPANQLSALPGVYTTKNVMWDTNTQLPADYVIPGPAVFTCPS